MENDRRIKLRGLVPGFQPFSLATESKLSKEIFVHWGQVHFVSGFLNQRGMSLLYSEWM